VIALDQDHSNMVKLEDHDPLIPVLADIMKSICRHSYDGISAAAPADGVQGTDSPHVSPRPLPGPASGEAAALSETQLLARGE